ncbi:NAD(P)H-binding protein [Paenibacillus sp. 481]|uniref:NAD(P)H-binding protein n=1 Tax=Paenibacillus sp. 481 TaxID=2835869 RepID=UPI001E51D58A|nr:NAD(P)H-binding protein [Paenibacillus sp. 481]UHA71881.1 NAD(P)H-binding protein [Paenibacillus sp. 481]
MTILVTGATGKVGRHIVSQLQQANHHVRALTRNSEQANFPAGVEVVSGDLASPAAIAEAFQGVTGLHLITFNGDAYTPLNSASEIIELAKKAGVQRITVLCGPEESVVEQAVKASGIDWTMLHPVEFMGNAIWDWGYSIREAGIVKEPFPHALSAKVHEADIAAVAVTALLNEGHAGKSYVLTGPEALTRVESFRILSEALGRDIPFIELTEDEARDQWRAEGYGEEDIAFFIEMGANTPEIGFTVLPTIEEVTGRPARTFAQWAAEHVQAFN